MPDRVPSLIPTTVVGSYSLPKWLEAVRDLATQGKLGDDELEEAHDNAVKSCLLDQELAGVDIVTDGELRRETMIYFFNRHIRGFRLYGPMRPIGTLDPSIQMPDPVVESRVARGGIPLGPHWAFAQAHSRKLVKVCVTGPHMLAKRATNQAYRSDRELGFDLAAILNAELRDLVRAGCRFIQIDEPVWVGYPGEVRAWAVEAFNRTVDGLDAKITLHICYGNYQRKRLFPGTYRDLFPAVLGADASQLVLEFAVEDLSQFDDVVGEFPSTLELGLGVVDVKTDDLETPAGVAARIRRALERIGPDRLYVNPDCGLKFTRRAVALAKLQAMVEGAAIVRAEVAGHR
ncbi:MAG: methionine synthase [Candidatus Rokubacteria bacterium]|nr:methionine synthase [Candidatus Rokubacteria bacterium]